MALFVLGDTHLSLGGSKPMDVFPGWNNYVERLEANWRKLVHPEDTIVLAGDISWAMRLTDTRKDFAFLQELPGQKLIMKGNHDYWWSTANKMNAYLKAEGFDTLHILHNNSYTAEGYALCGTRGWLFDVGEPHDEKVMNREIGRLRMSLDAAEPGLEKLVFLHYPPVYTGTSAPEIVATLNQYGIKRCFYGHLHGNALRYAVQGEVDGIQYKLVSADGLRFCPYRIYDVTATTDDPADASFSTSLLSDSDLDTSFTADGSADAIRALPMGEATAVQYSTLAMMMAVRLDPLQMSALDALRATALSDMKSAELQDALAEYGASLPHSLDASAMSKLPAKKIVNNSANSTTRS